MKFKRTRVLVTLFLLMIVAMLPVLAASADAVTGGAQTATVFGAITDDGTVSAGQAVKKGDVLCILEAMKMENEIMAPHDATVAQVLAEAGAKVDTGTPLIVLG